MNKQHVARLPDRHRETLSGRLSAGSGRARELMHARSARSGEQGHVVGAAFVKGRLGRILVMQPPMAGGEGL
jgi:hypothetical protein